jgi:hypothetical protein
MGGELAAMMDLLLESSVMPTMTDALGHSSGYQTDLLGNVTSMTDAYGNVTTIERDANGLPMTLTQPSPDGVAAQPHHLRPIVLAIKGSLAAMRAGSARRQRFMSHHDALAPRVRLGGNSTVIGPPPAALGVTRRLFRAGVAVAGVLLDVERDQFPDGRDIVQRIEVQPLMLEHAPPGLDHRIRELDLRLGKDAFQEARLHKLVHGRVEILDAAIHQRRGHGRRCHAPRCLDQDLRGDPRVETLSRAPGENSPRKVIDDGMQVTRLPIRTRQTRNPIITQPQQNRMAVVVPLDQDLRPVEALRQVRHIPAYPVSTLVNSPRNNNPECLEPIEEPK